MKKNYKQGYSRKYLEEAFVGLGATIYGMFDRKQGSGYLFRYIRVEGVQKDGQPFVGREHHLWIFRGCKMLDLMQFSMKKGDKFRIKGEPYLYRRKTALTIFLSEIYIALKRYRTILSRLGKK